MPSELLEAPETEQAEQQQEPAQELSETIKASLKELMKKASEREMYARLAEIQDTWMQRFFERGIQHVYWDITNRTLQISGTNGGALTGDESTSAQMPTYNDSFNIYRGYGKSFCAVFCQNQASNRAEPLNPKEAMDIAAAREAQKLKRVIEDSNDHKEMQRQISRFLYTDRRVVAWTRFISKKDADGKEVGKKQTDIYGTLESKVPIVSRDIEKWPYCQIQFERDITEAKFENPDIKSQITGGQSGQASDLASRNARISVSQGIPVQSQSGETNSNLVTETHNFFRPSFYEALSDTARDELLESYPEGVYCKYEDDILADVQKKKLEDEIAVMHAMPGDGQSRVSIGADIVPVQENFNDLMNQAIEIYDYCIPAKWIDEEIIDIDAVQEQQASPGQYHPAERKGGEPLGDCFWEETAVTMPADMAAFMEKLATELPQFLTAQQPSLMGAEMGEAGKTAKGYQMAANQALGIMGYIWKPYTTFYATITQQSVDCTAKARQEEGEITALVSKQRKSAGREEISIDLQDLANGNYKFRPEGDAQFPETWTQKRAVYMSLLEGSQQNPALAKELEQPDNMALAKDLIGLEDFTIVEQESRDKQLAEIDEMIRASVGPIPEGEPAVPPNPAMPAPPPEQSSIPIDVDYDNHQVEFAEVQRYINSPEGQKLKSDNPAAFADIRLHGLEHKAALQAQQQAQAAAAMAMQPQAPTQGEQVNA